MPDMQNYCKDTTMSTSNEQPVAELDRFNLYCRPTMTQLKDDLKEVKAKTDKMYAILTNGLIDKVKALSKQNFLILSMFVGLIGLDIYIITLVLKVIYGE